MIKSLLISILTLLPVVSFAEEEKPLTSTTSASNSYSNTSDWKIESSMIIPFRGFEIQTSEKNSQTQDPLGSISYKPSASLEGQVYIRYKTFGLNYSRTLFSSSLDSSKNLPSSINQSFRFNIFLDQDLYELTQQNIKGMRTSVNTTSTTEETIARSDIKLSDTRLRWVHGIPVWGSEKPNTLANFYSSANIPKGQMSFDLLTSVEFNNQEVSADSPFIPSERQSTFGTASSLSKISSTGLGLGGGFGITTLMNDQSYFSIGALLGGNLSHAKSQYADKEESAYGFGLYANAWMAAHFLFGAHSSQNIVIRLAHSGWQIPAHENKVITSDSAMSVTYGVAL